MVNRDFSSSTSLTPHYVLCPTDLLHATSYLHLKGFQSCDVLLSYSSYFCTVQGHTSNQCFHHSFLEASSFFSSPPWVFFPPGKGFFSLFYPGGKIRGRGAAPP